MRPNTWIVVPLYNEAAVVRETIEKLLPIGGRIVVVDDGSTDGGAEKLDGLDVTLIRHPFNLGQGAALCTGFKYALSEGADYIATFDSDGQYLASDLVAMQDYLVGATDEAASDNGRVQAAAGRGGQSPFVPTTPQKGTVPAAADSASLGRSPPDRFDFVTGSRFLGTTVNMPRTRRMLVRASRFLAWLLYGLKLTDTQNGVRMMNRHAASKMLFTQNRMAHAMEAHARVARHGLRHSEFPNTMIYTEYSRSKGQRDISGSLRILSDLLLAGRFSKRTLALQRQVTALAQNLAIAGAQKLNGPKSLSEDRLGKGGQSPAILGHASEPAQGNGLTDHVNPNGAECETIAAGTAPSRPR